MSGTSHTQKDYLARQDLGSFELSICGRYRVYPQEPSQTVTLNTGAGADQWGAWTEIIPANIIPFDYNIVGILIETISATGIYQVQIGDCAAGSTPVTNEIQGEVRFRGTAPIARSTETLVFGCRIIRAYRRVMGRVKNDSGGDNITLSAVIRRYIELSEEVEKWPTFPW